MSKNKKVVIVLGAGIGGQIVSRGIIDNFKDCKVCLIGKINQNLPGLFYFNQRIPNICEKEIKVTYNKIGEGSLKDYQIKSKGYSDLSLTNSSFNLIGKSVPGYLLSSKILTNDERFYVMQDFAVCVSLKNKYVILSDGTGVKFDYLISTIPFKNFLDATDRLTPEISDQFNCKSVYFKTIGLKSIPDSEISSISVFYDLTDNTYYRHSSYYGKDGEVLKMVSETLSPVTSEKDEVSVLGKIIPNHLISENVFKIEDEFSFLKLCGRYARWDYHYTVDQSYFSAINFLRMQGLS